MAPKVRLNVLTYNRPDTLLEVLGRVTGDVELVVYDDGSSLDYRRVDALVADRQGRVVRARRNHGKRLFGRWLETVHRDAAASAASIFISIPDDMLPCRDFVRRACDAWSAIADDRKLALNLHRDHRTSCWGSGPPVDVGCVLSTGWIDGAFICGPKYYRVVAERSLRVTRDWKAQPHLGSGVYQAISMFVRNRGFRLYGVKNSLLRHLDVPSQMNPEARACNSLATVDFVDDVSEPAPSSVRALRTA